jgi:hypothetical protein
LLTLLLELLLEDELLSRLMLGEGFGQVASLLLSGPLGLSE